jgi:hypothetical protein
MTLWQFAYRFGRMTPGGIRLHMPLTHSQLACAQRPSVTTAIACPRDPGDIALTARHRRLLRGKWPSCLSAAADDAAGV